MYYFCNSVCSEKAPSKLHYSRINYTSARAYLVLHTIDCKTKTDITKRIHDTNCGSKILKILRFFYVFSGSIMSLRKFNQYTWLYSASILFIQHYNILNSVYKLDVEHNVTLQKNINRTTVQYFDRVQSTVSVGYPVFKFQFCLRHHTNVTLNQICGYSDIKLTHLDITIDNLKMTTAVLSKYERGMHKPSACQFIFRSTLIQEYIILQ